ncbi:formylglycine-generating enzyme family protein [Desulfosarcina ovata]|nr:formylglycine-generating enzyme family protein [Desulfosarcina ovata]
MNLFYSVLEIVSTKIRPTQSGCTKNKVYFHSWLVMVTVLCLVGTSEMGCTVNLGVLKSTSAPPAGWILVLPSTFMMGARMKSQSMDEDGERQDNPKHQVKMTNAFWMQPTEVTQEQFAELMGFNPARFVKCGPRCPVDQVSWDEAAEYCNALSQEEGLEFCYDCWESKGKVHCQPSKGYPMPYDCKGYRLPTEAEWEYACRGGDYNTVTVDNNIQGPRNAPSLDPGSWYGGNCGVSYEGAHDCSSWFGRQYEALKCGTHPVAAKMPNSLGLYDMLGNVWEWCSDWYGEYMVEPITDPAGPKSGRYRVYRGGSWLSYAWHVHPAFRGWQPADLRFGENGFRCVRTVPIDHPATPFQ